MYIPVCTLASSIAKALVYSLSCSSLILLKSARVSVELICKTYILFMQRKLLTYLLASHLNSFVNYSAVQFSINKYVHMYRHRNNIIRTPESPPFSCLYGL